MQYEDSFKWFFGLFFEHFILLFILLEYSTLADAVEPNYEKRKDLHKDDWGLFARRRGQSRSGQETKCVRDFSSDLV